MADSLCGPSNALQNFQKHTSVDRTLQQDRLSTRQSPSQAFRSQNPNAGALDTEFAAFEAGVVAPPIPDIQTPLFNHASPHAPDLSHAASPGWASDFQKLQLSDPAHSVPGLQFQAGDPHQANLGGWQSEFMHQQRLPSPQQPMLQPQTLQGNYRFGLANSELTHRASPLSGTPQGLNQATKPEEVFDESAFEAAFDQARAEIELQETHTAETQAQTNMQDEEIKIGSDTIPQAEKSDTLNSNDNSDELARTAGQLLDSVSHDQSQKFKDSNFLALMRRIRDREVRVEGDEFRDVRSDLALMPHARSDSNSPIHLIIKRFALSTILKTSTIKARWLIAIPLQTIALSSSREPAGSPATALPYPPDDSEDESYTAPPPHSPISEASSSSLPPGPPPFSSLYFTPDEQLGRPKNSVTESGCPSVPAFSPPTASAQSSPFDEASAHATPPSTVVTDTKAALSRDKQGESSGKGPDDGEPPPPYTEGSSPLDSFTYVMAAAGGAASIITQVQQTGGPPINTLGDIGGDEHITLELRGTRFTLSRDELLTLPEFVLLSLFPNGLLPDGHMGSYHEGDVYPVDYDPASLQYMLDFFRSVAQSIPSSSPSPTTSPETDQPNDQMQGSARDMLQDRAGIIVLREDLDFYVIPPTRDIDHPEMLEVKRAAGKALLNQDGIFSGLRKSDEIGTTEQHLIEMLTAGGFNHDDSWGHRAGEPSKAVICSLGLAKLRTDIKGDMNSNNAVGMAQKLLLFWRKPARRCWWEGVELHDVEGVEGKLKVWVRRVWTLEMSVIGLR
ncbi:hypothetical protein FQN54_002212 [Arachnomyces sp. PD_36]|nr:hypothetical protein FQN54_002212 [Arachnomyces sp. PD_36]